MKRILPFAVVLLVIILPLILAKQALAPVKEKTIQPVSKPGRLFLPPSSSPTPDLAKITIGLVGDLGLGRHITSTAKSKNDFTWSFQKIGPWLSENDLNIANLESPIIKNCPEGKTGTFTFCGDDRFLPVLKPYNFIFNLSNNHILNYSASGLVQTKTYLTQREIPFVYSHSDDSKFTKVDKKGITLGFIGYDFVTYPDLNKDMILKEIESHDQEVDWLVVSLHWGNEYLLAPEKWRQEFAQKLIAAGADIIHGHHPHVWQPYEKTGNKVIFYSFGNFIFDQSWSYNTSHSQIAKLELSKNEIIDLKLFPIEIKYNSQPWLMD